MLQVLRLCHPRTKDDLYKDMRAVGGPRMTNRAFHRHMLGMRDRGLVVGRYRPGPQGRVLWFDLPEKETA